MFAETYAEAREAFRAEAQAAGGQLETLDVVEVEGHGMLTIDAAIFGPESSRALVVSSGLHGVEGFAGSAIQRQCIASGASEGVRVVLIHALNPFGMACSRRVNENNIDLNRNFCADAAEFSGASDGYRMLEPFLNPKTPHTGLELVELRALWLILRHGMPTLKQAVAGGQYEFPKGVFYGGDELQPGPEALLKALPTWLGGAERLVYIDVHTGLGKSGTYSLLVDHEDGSERHLACREAFGSEVQPWMAGQGVAYQITGGLPGAIEALFGESAEVLTQEFGTVPPISVIKALRAENRATHWGGDLTSAREKLKRTFYPVSDRWKADILRGGAHVISRAIAHLERPDAG
jgi:hypothetical protein